jgi:hypothetical protein
MALMTLSVSLSCSSCSGKKTQPVFPVHGKVFFQGEPAAGALVVFHSTKHSEEGEEVPRAVVEADGSFSVTTYTARDGAPAGDYAVSITWKMKTVKPQSGKRPPKKIATNFPERYQDPKTSGLVVHVQDGSNELRPFEITD